MNRVVGQISLLGIIAVSLAWSVDLPNHLASHLDRAAASIPPSSIILKDKFRNWGLASNFTKAHIQAEDAWKIENGSRDVVVAVVDTGVDVNHPDLKPNIWFNPNAADFRRPFSNRKYGKKPRKQKVYGFDFVTGRPNPSDTHGHGTHVAGIIGAVANKKQGISGVARKVSIMAIRYYSESNPGSVNLNNTIKGLHYAIDNGARIINYSGGGPEASGSERTAIKKADQRNVLIVAAAGNERKDSSIPKNYYYPAAYRTKNIISVAAIDMNGKLLNSSNWGKTVDVAAPGHEIFSTIPGNRYGYMTGTSQATAFVSGIAALLLSQEPSLTPAQIIDLIKTTVDPIPGLKVATGGKVNAYKALKKLRSWKRSRKQLYSLNLFQR